MDKSNRCRSYSHCKTGQNEVEISISSVINEVLKEPQKDNRSSMKCLFTSNIQ